jgi:hypothetical protein
MRFDTKDHLSPELEYVPTNMEMFAWMHEHFYPYRIRAITDGCCEHPDMPRDDGRCIYSPSGLCQRRADISAFQKAFIDWLDAGAPLSLTLNPEEL